jgi:hypothetical protein
VTSRILVGGVCLRSLWVGAEHVHFCLPFPSRVHAAQTSPTTPDVCTAETWEVQLESSDASAVNPADWQAEMDVLEGLLGGGGFDWWGSVFHGEIVRM